MLANILDDLLGGICMGVAWFWLALWVIVVMVCKLLKKNRTAKKASGVVVTAQAKKAVGQIITPAAKKK